MPAATSAEGDDQIEAPFAVSGTVNVDHLMSPVFLSSADMKPRNEPPISSMLPLLPPTNTTSPATSGEDEPSAVSVACVFFDHSILPSAALIATMFALLLSR